MRNAAIFVPLPGTNQTVNLLYNKGLYEIINDSPHALQINAVGGGATIEAGAKVLFSNSQGGNNIAIFTIQEIKTDTTGLFNVGTIFPPITANMLCIVNEYNADEIDSDSYPANISRVALPGVRQPITFSVRLLGSATFTSTMFSYAGFYAQRTGLNPTGFNSFAAQQVYCLGFDFTGPPRTVTAIYQIVLSGLFAPDSLPTSDQFQWTASSTVQGGPQLIVRFPIPLVNDGAGNDSVVNITGLDAGLIYNFTAYGCVQ